MTTTTTAPGKVVLMGEYAVLEGAPALVMAVDRRVRVSVSAHAEPYCSLRTPGWREETARFEVTPGGVVWLEGGGDGFALVSHLLEACLRGAAAAGQGFELVVDSTPLLQRVSGRVVKLGLGSSAALAVALHHAVGYHVATQHGTGSRSDLRELIDIHSAFQGRHGSGLDVAASLNGGLIEYVGVPAPRVRPCRLPERLEYGFVWSGRQAATRDFLAAVAKRRQDDPRGYEQALKPMVDAAAAAADAARANDSDGFLEIADDYFAALGALGRASGTDILSEPHWRLRAIAGKYGVVYKPCGAGGGDIGVGMASDAGALARFQAEAAAENFLPLSLNIDQDGVLTRAGN